MRSFLKVLCLVVILSCTGCDVFVVERLMDKMGDFAERMEKIDKERRAELRQQVASIEGEIAKAEMVEKEVEEDVTSFKSVNGKEEIVTEKKKTIKKVYTVYFADGREKVFPVPDKPLVAGKYYIIKYNGLNEIIDISEKMAE